MFTGRHALLVLILTFLLVLGGVLVNWAAIDYLAQDTEAVPITPLVEAGSIVPA